MRSFSRSTGLLKITPAAPRSSSAAVGMFLGCPSTNTMAPRARRRFSGRSPVRPGSPSRARNSPVPTSSRGRSASVPKSTRGARTPSEETRIGHGDGLEGEILGRNLHRRRDGIAGVGVEGVDLHGHTALPERHDDGVDGGVLAGAPGGALVVHDRPGQTLEAPERDVLLNGRRQLIGSRRRRGRGARGSREHGEEQRSP